jgi:hypothetical protein
LDSSIVQGAFSVAPCQTLISRFAYFASLMARVCVREQGRGGCGGGGRVRRLWEAQLEGLPSQPDAGQLRLVRRVPRHSAHALGRGQLPSRASTGALAAHRTREPACTGLSPPPGGLGCRLRREGSRGRSTSRCWSGCGATSARGSTWAALCPLRMRGACACPASLRCTSSTRAPAPPHACAVRA